jgi:hypothetical protein
MHLPENTIPYQLHISFSVCPVVHNISGSRRALPSAAQTSKPSDSQLLEVTAIKPVHHPQNEIKIAWGEITRI